MSVYATSESAIFHSTPKGKPKTVAQALELLNSHMTTENLAQIQAMPEDALYRLHFGLGRWIRNNWIYQGDKELLAFFKTQRLRHPDDMSTIIIQSFWRTLHKKPIQLIEQIHYYQNYWKKRQLNAN